MGSSCRIVLLIALIGLSSGRVSMSTTSVTIPKDSSASVTFRLSEPIVCKQQKGAECAVVIRVDNPAADRIALSPCVVKWTNADWHQPRVLKVNVLENFMNDAALDVQLITKPILSDSEYYSDYDINDIRVKTVSRPSSTCTGSGDPHYRTFDGLGYSITSTGRYVMYGSPVNNFELQVLMEGVAWHCAFAAREDNDLVVVYNCGGRSDVRRLCATSECRGGGFPRIQSVGGNKYQVQFKSGRIIRMGAAWTRFSLSITAPGRDYKAGTYGICGAWDGSGSNDRNVRLSPTIDLFNFRPTASPPPPPPPPALAECPYEPPRFVPPILNDPNVEDITDILRQMAEDNEREELDDLPIVLDDIDDIVPIDEGDQMTEEQADARCRPAMTQSDVGVACMTVIPDFDPEPFIEGCVEDMRLIDDESMIAAALEAMKEFCADEGGRRLDTWETDEDGNPLQPKSELSSSLCPNSCSGNGQCVNVTCVCDADFTTSDCSVNKNSAPAVSSISEHYCDTQGGRCPARIEVKGENFWVSDDFGCRFENKATGEVKATQGFVLGSTSALCAIPSLLHRGSSPLEFEVSVVTSNSSALNPTNATFSFFDGICQLCSASGCVPNAQSCTINGTCYRSSEQAPSNPCQVCDPVQSTTEWTFSSLISAEECGPVFDVATKTVPVSKEIVAGQQIDCLNADNDRLEGFLDLSVTYSLVDADNNFVIGADDGCVSAVNDISFAPGSKPFNQVLSITATDVGGSSASMELVINPIQVNSNPVFDLDVYEFSVPEDAAVGSVVGDVRASDLDEKNISSLTYSWFTSQSVFSVDAQSGSITLAESLDFEMLSQYALILRAADDAGQYHVTRVAITVADVNEAPTDILLSTTAVTEGIARGAVVADISVADPEMGTHTCTVEGSSPFRVEDMQLLADGVIDFETSSEHAVDVSLACVDEGGLSLVKNLSLHVIDVNEPPKNVRLSTTTFSEDARNVIAQVFVDDEDNSVDPQRQQVACSLANSNNGQFAIEGGNLIVLRQLDFETSPSVQISMQCADDGTPALFSDVAVFDLTIVDANDNVQDLTFVGDNVPESTGTGTVIGKIRGYDYDSNAGDISFAILSQGYALVGAASCESAQPQGVVCEQDIELTKMLDYETARVERISVQAEDNLKSLLVTEITFNVSDTNDAPSGVVLSQSSVFENVTKDMLISVLTASDDDLAQSHAFVLTNATDLVYLSPGPDSSSVELRVKDASAFDFEVRESLTIGLQVTDDDAEDPKSVVTAVTIVIKDEPLAVYFDSDYASSVPVSEAAAAGSVVAELTVYGNDDGAALSVVVDESGPVYAEGMKLLLKDDALDYEQDQVVSFTVSLVDASGNVLSQQVLSLAVEDENEPPVFAHKAYSVLVKDDEARGTTLSVEPAPLAARDPESPLLGMTYLLNKARTDPVLVSILQVSAQGAIRMAQRPSAVMVPGASFVLVVDAVCENGETASVEVVVSVQEDCRNSACSADEECRDTGLLTYICCDDSGNCIDSLTALERSPAAAASQQASDSGASVAMITGVVVGVLLLVVLVAIVLVYRRKNVQTAGKWDADALETLSNPMYMASHSANGPVSSHAAAIIPGIANPMYSWYRPEMTRQECQSELENSEPGTFFVRDSKATPGWFLLGVRTPSEIYHEQVRNSGSQYQLVSRHVAAEQPKFNDLPQLVSHYSTAQPSVGFVLSNPTDYTNPMPQPAFEGPAVPIKERDVSALQQIAGVDDVYSNASAARSALESTL